MKKQKNYVVVSIILFALVIAIMFFIVVNKPQQNNQQPIATQQTSSDSANKNQVDPILKNTIINAFLSAKALYASGNLVSIRKYLMDAYPEKTISLSDSDLQNLVASYNQIASTITENTLQNPDTLWTFNQDATSVEISFKTTLSSGKPEIINIVMLYKNGQWYF